MDILIAIKNASTMYEYQLLCNNYEMITEQPVPEEYKRSIKPYTKNEIHKSIVLSNIRLLVNSDNKIRKITVLGEFNIAELQNYEYCDEISVDTDFKWLRLIPKIDNINAIKIIGVNNIDYDYVIENNNKQVTKLYIYGNRIDLIPDINIHFPNITELRINPENVSWINKFPLLEKLGLYVYNDIEYNFDDQLNALSSNIQFSIFVTQQIQRVNRIINIKRIVDNILLKLSVYNSEILIALLIFADASIVEYVINKFVKYYNKYISFVEANIIFSNKTTQLIKFANMIRIRDLTIKIRNQANLSNIDIIVKKCKLLEAIIIDKNNTVNSNIILTLNRLYEMQTLDIRSYENGIVLINVDETIIPLVLTNK